MRLTAAKPLTLSAGTTAPEIVRAIARAEKAYQEELNRGLARLSEGAFKALRRQLPVTRQKVRLSGRIGVGATENESAGEDAGNDEA